MKLIKCRYNKIKTNTSLHMSVCLSFPLVIHEYFFFLVYLRVNFRFVNSILRGDRIMLCCPDWPQSTGYE